MGSSFKVKDNGYNQMMTRLGSFKNLGVQVGVFGANAEKQYEDGTTTGFLAEVHEYGLGTQEERSWLRAYVDENQGRIQEMIRIVAQEHAKGRMTAAQGLDLIGLKIVGEIRQRIADGIPPPLKQATINRKGSSVPLIESGQFRSSIASMVINMATGGAP